MKNYKIKHFCFTLKRSQVNFSFNVIVCKVLKSLHVVVHAKLIILKVDYVILNYERRNN